MPDALEEGTRGTFTVEMSEYLYWHKFASFRFWDEWEASER
ncbi:hypothetical protein DNAM5_148 [Haloarcula californiae tailed virus 1]|uniref:Uncharacterized protein n=1 Tax=Haloarcula californiae tailed virus 1 TaxID=1273746 RepID=R4TAN1_9CAUD|nr:hypothetical protein M202_gp073 [Haloarcula californiae tailed virus 1]AGM12005.1 hypothetical protein DNAM5_148 [Haloarcula californiae tailed virus 1]